MQSFSMQGQERVHHVNFLRPHQRGVQHFSLPEYSENSGKCISITLSTHVETVILLSRKTLDAVININLDMSELDLTSAESKATYAEIKKYVLDKFGLKVSQFYIAQVKREFGLIERINYNVGEGKNHVPQVTPEKREAIIDALKHFQMIE
jgi:hypothetical protein